MLTYSANRWLIINNFILYPLIQFLWFFKNLFKFYLPQKFRFWKKFNPILIHFSFFSVYFLKTKKFWSLKFKNFNVLSYYKFIVYNNFNFYLLWVLTPFFRNFYLLSRNYYYYFIFCHLRILILFNKLYPHKVSLKCTEFRYLEKFNKWHHLI